MYRRAVENSPAEKEYRLYNSKTGSKTRNSQGSDLSTDTVHSIALGCDWLEDPWGSGRLGGGIQQGTQFVCGLSDIFVVDIILINRGLNKLVLVDGW